MSAGPPREYPDAPRVGVGAVVLDGDRVLLVRRGAAPSLGKWSIPGGLVDLGERLEDAVVREVHEECGIAIKPLGLCGVIDRVTFGETTGAAGARVRYHYVIIDYAAAVVGGEMRAGSDAAEARWVRLAELHRYETTDGLAAMIERAVCVSARESTQGGSPT